MLNDLSHKLRASSSAFYYYEGGKKKSKPHAEVYSDALKVLAFFQQEGLAKTDLLAICARNSYFYVLVDIACILKGIKTIPFDPTVKWNYKVAFPEHGVTALISDKEMADVTGIKKMDIGKVLSHTETDSFTPHHYGPDDIFTIIFSSGSYALPKAVEVNVRSFTNLVSESYSSFGFKSTDTMLVFFPFHIYLQRCYILASIFYNFNVLLVFPEQVFAALQKDKPTILISVPLMFETFHKVFLTKINANFILRTWLKAHLFLNTHFFSRKKLRFYPFIKAFGGNIRYLLTGSAPINLSTLTFFSNMGLIIYEGYGMTETGGMIALNTPAKFKLGSVGKPFPGKQISFDEAGHIIVKSEYHGATGYYKPGLDEIMVFNPPQTIFTGDTGYMDEEGFIYITGRIRDTIILSNGKKINPQEIELSLLANHQLKTVVVYGNNMPFLTALVIPESKSVSEETVQAAINRCNKELPPHKQVVKHFVTYKPFSVEEGLINTGFKVNRLKVHEVYKNDFLSMYNQ